MSEIVDVGSLGELEPRTWCVKPIGCCPCCGSFGSVAPGPVVSPLPEGGRVEATLVDPSGCTVVTVPSGVVIVVGVLPGGGSLPGGDAPLGCVPGAGVESPVGWVSLDGGCSLGDASPMGCGSLTLPGRLSSMGAGPPPGSKVVRVPP